MPEELNEKGMELASTAVCEYLHGKEGFSESWNIAENAIKAYLPYHDKQRDERIAELMEALELLWHAKQIKENLGKVPAYEKMKNEAWEVTRKIMESKE